MRRKLMAWYRDEEIQTLKMHGSARRRARRFAVKPGPEGPGMVPDFKGLKARAPRTSCRLGFAGGVGSDPFENGTNGDAAGTFRDVRLGVLDPGDASDVEMNPGGVFGEDVEELGSINGSAPPA